MDLFDEQVEKKVQKRLSEELSKVFENPREMIRMYQKALEQSETENNLLKPKASFYDSVTQSDDWMEMSTAVKTITFAGKPIGRNKMFALLRDKGVLRSNDYHMNEPYQQYVDRGYFKIVEMVWASSESENFVGRKTVVSQKGLEFLIKLVNEAYSE